MAEPRKREMTELEERVLNVATRPMSFLNTWIYRVTDGRIGGKFLRGAPVLLLTHTGRNTGTVRTTPLIYLDDPPRVVLVASKGGSKRHPQWYLNLEAHPDVEVQIGAEHRKCRARTASAAEKDALWPRLLQIYRDYDDYQARTRRDIPVVILEPRS
jgi:deazaflavin-dependent oxidoreductase (nitroreductase family)